MKKLIFNEFLYYVKNPFKLLISIAIILSFPLVYNEYTNLEQVKLKEESNHLVNIQTKNSSFYSSLTQKYFTLESIDFDKLDELTIIQGLLQNYSGGLVTQINGNMNVQISSFRYEIMKLYDQVYQLIGDDAYLLLSDFHQDSYDFIQSELNRLSILVNNNWVDENNEYTITLANYPSRVFEGLSLFTILALTLLLFYDLFSKDFENETYKTIYSTPIKRSKIVLSKLLFSLLYLFTLLIIGQIIVSIYLLLYHTDAYNLLSNKHGNILHPSLININSLNSFNKKVKYIIIPEYLKNIIFTFIGSSLIVLWISFLNIISFKSKSSSTTLSIGVFVLFMSNVLNLLNINIIKILVPISAYNFQTILISENSFNFISTILFTIFYIILFNYLLFKSVNTNDFVNTFENE